MPCMYSCATHAARTCRQLQAVVGLLTSGQEAVSTLHGIAGGVHTSGRAVYTSVG